MFALFARKEQNAKIILAKKKWKKNLLFKIDTLTWLIAVLNCRCEWKCGFLPVGFDEQTETDQFFTWHKVQVEDDELQQLKELHLDVNRLQVDLKNKENLV